MKPQGTESTTTAPGYRPEVDGLRALAVIPVILYHSATPGFQGGFVGVDIFFVISGYLISSLIFVQLDAGKFSLTHFYHRRYRRIVPALLFVMLLSLPLAWFSMLPSQLREFGQSVVATVLFAANLFFHVKVDYWAESVDTLPLIHAWSLGVEEQFYLLYPLILMAAWRYKLPRAPLLLSLTVFSFAAALAVASRDPHAAFYLPHLRFWELLIGALVAQSEPSLRRWTTAWLQPLLAVMALVLIAAVVAFAGGQQGSNQVLERVLPVLATAVLLFSLREGAGVGAWLGGRTLVVIGLRSYSLYLFHQPVLAFFRLLNFGALGTTEIAAAWLVTIALSEFSFRCVEQPCRDPNRTGLPALALASTASLALLLGFGLTMHNSDGMQEYKLRNLSPQHAALVRNLEAETRTATRLRESYLATAEQAFAADDRIRVVVVGDSISKDVYTALRHGSRIDEWAQLRRLRFAPACAGPLAGLSEEPGCMERNQQLLAQLRAMSPDAIVIAAYWQQQPQHAAAAAEFFAAQGWQALIVTPAGFIPAKSSLLYLQRQGLGPDEPVAQGFFYRHRAPRALKMDELVPRFRNETGLKVLRMYDRFCDDISERCRLFTAEGLPLLRDAVHLSAQGYSELGPWLEAELHDLVKPR